MTRTFFGVIDLRAALLVAFGVFIALPARWWPVDAGAVAVSLLLAAAGIAILTRQPWAARVVRIASLVVLALGLLLIAALSLSVSYLSGVYGSVGRGGAIILVLVAALALPYLVILPVAQLLWIGARDPAQP